MAFLSWYGYEGDPKYWDMTEIADDPEAAVHYFNATIERTKEHIKLLEKCREDAETLLRNSPEWKALMEAHKKVEDAEQSLRLALDKQEKDREVE